MAARGEHELDPGRIVTLRGLGRQDPGPGGGRASGVGPVDEQCARARTTELERGRGPDHAAADDDHVERAHESSVIAHPRGVSGHHPRSSGHASRQS